MLQMIQVETNVWINTNRIEGLVKAPNSWFLSIQGIDDSQEITEEVAQKILSLTGNK